MNEIERDFQDAYDVIGSNGMNCKLTKVGDRSGRLTQETKDKMVNTRMSKGTYYTKDLHPRAKHFTAINPEGVAFELHGNLKDFCKEMNLSWQTLYGNVNSGIIILDRSRYKNLSRLTNRFFNTLGWQIYSQ